MKQIIKELESRIITLEKFQNKLSSELRNAPEGILRVISKRNSNYFYRRQNTQDKIGKYVSKKDLPLIKALAQKEYNLKALHQTSRNIHCLNSILSDLRKYDSNYLIKIFQSLPESRKSLIDPLFQTDEEYLKQWQAVAYQGKPFSNEAPVYCTSKGERVRSKSEILIADRLTKMGIPYRYEYPLYLKGFGTIYPDFLLLNLFMKREIILEHFGLVDQPDYANNMVRKIETYEKNGYYLGENLLITMETSAAPLNMRMFDEMIRHYFNQTYSKL